MIQCYRNSLVYSVFKDSVKLNEQRVFSDRMHPAGSIQGLPIFRSLLRPNGRTNFRTSVGNEELCFSESIVVVLVEDFVETVLVETETTKAASSLVLSIDYSVVMQALSEKTSVTSTYVRYTSP